MPTHDPAARLTTGGLEAAVQRLCFAPSGGPDRVGLEVELLPVHTTADGWPAGRVRLDAITRWLGVGPPEADDSPGSRLEDGTRLTFEPGGQVELSTACHTGPVPAADAANRAAARLQANLAPHGVTLAAVGVDPWHRPPGQQLTASRYPAMAAYLAARGPAGAVMMRHTASLQVNLDLGGDPATISARWQAANLVAPLATATFASVAAPGIACLRGAVWQRTDPTRTGYPDLGAGPPARQVARALAAADMLLVPGPDGRSRPGRVGWSFGDWLRDGHPTLGWPTEADLATHLTTWFPEVRPRHGTIELRGVDALPARWRVVPALLLAALIYDPVARDHAADLLTPHRDQLPALHRRCVRDGVADPRLCALAVEVWSRARQGALRLGFAPAAVAAVDGYLDRFTTRGRTPADELAALRADPPRALAWAAEPTQLAVVR